MKPKLLLIAYRAFGDWIYAAPVLPYLFEKYDIYLETNPKTFQLVEDDPRFKEITVFDFSSIPQDDWGSAFAHRWAKRREEVQPDAEITLNGTLEVNAIAERGYPNWDWPLAARRAVYGDKDFYEETFRRCNVPFPENFDPGQGLYFTGEQLAWGEHWKAEQQGRFTVIIPVAGSTMHKTFHNYEHIVWTILNMDLSAQVYIAGDTQLAGKVIKHKRVFDMCTDVPIKQAILMTKHADYVIGPETSLLVAAGYWGTPKSLLATTSGVNQMVEHHKNDYSLQAPIYCSPCHRAVYKEEDCQTRVYSEKGEFLTPACAKMFNQENLQGVIFNVYNKWKASTQALAGNIR